MAEEESRYLAYMEDMYEDRKGQKKVKVRWFHHNREVKGVISLRNPHPKEVFITPYAQVISAECVDGPAIILTREHYEKCAAVFPHDVLARVHICYRQFRSNRVKPFNISTLRGYFDQPIFSCFGPDFFEDEECNPADNVKLGTKRTRSCREHQTLTCEPLEKFKLGLLKHDESQPCHTPLFKVDEKIELLCQDSGIRGCWFRCTVLQVSRRHMKVQYDDVKDEDGCGNLEEWVLTFRLAMPDKLGMRHSGRTTIRPALALDPMDLDFGVGAPVDAWWNDGWWEGIVTGVDNSENESHRVYIPSENLLLNIDRKELRVSRDWVGGQWMDIEASPDIVTAISAAISPDAKISVSSNICNEAANIDDGCRENPISIKQGVEERSNLEALAGSGVLSNEMDCGNDEKQQLPVEDEMMGTNVNRIKNLTEKDDKEKGAGNVNGFDNDDNKVDMDDSVNNLEMQEEPEAAGQKCEAHLMEVAA